MQVRRAQFMLQHVIVFSAADYVYVCVDAPIFVYSHGEMVILSINNFDNYILIDIK